MCIDGQISIQITISTSQIFNLQSANLKSHKGKSKLSNQIPEAKIRNQIPNLVLFSAQNSSNEKPDI